MILLFVGACCPQEAVRISLAKNIWMRNLIRMSMESVIWIHIKTFWIRHIVLICVLQNKSIVVLTAFVKQKGDEANP